MSRIDRLDPRHKLALSCSLIIFSVTGLAWWLLAELGHAQALAGAGLQPGSRAAAGMRAHYSHVLLVGWLGVGALALGAAMLGRWLSAQWTQPLRDATALALRVAGGDLTSHAPPLGAGADAQLLRAMQEMNDKLSASVAALRSGADEMAGGAGALATAQVRLATQAARDLAALHAAREAVTGIKAALSRGAAQAEATAGLAQAAAESSGAGAAQLQALTAAVDAEQRGAARLGQLAAAMEELTHGAGMLALGAAVEAAAAPDSGCAGLAREARVLAERLRAAARELDALQRQSAAGLAGAAALAECAAGALRASAAGAAEVQCTAGLLAADGVRHAGAFERVLDALAALERGAAETRALAAGSAATVLRERARAMARMLAGFRLTRLPQRGGGPLYLAASNPDLVKRPARKRRTSGIAAVKP